MAAAASPGLFDMTVSDILTGETFLVIQPELAGVDGP